MQLTFAVPDEFEVFEVRQCERAPCLIDCDVVALVRSKAPGAARSTHFLRRRPRTLLFAYVRLPAWVQAPAQWTRLSTGEICLQVDPKINRRAVIPSFGADFFWLDDKARSAAEQREGCADAADT